MNAQFLKSLVVCNAMAFILWMLVIMLLAVFRKANSDRSNHIRPGLLLLLFLYLASIVAVTLVPLPFSTDRYPGEDDLNFIPIARSIRIFLYPFRYNRMALLPDIIENLVGNVLMFIPLGILLPLLNNRFRSWRNILIVGFLFSCCIEGLQWLWRHFGNYRHVDVDDVILNTLGALIGFGIFYTALKIKSLFTPSYQTMNA